MSVRKEKAILGAGGAMGGERRAEQSQSTSSILPCETAASEVFSVWKISPSLLSTFKGQGLTFHAQLTPC